MADGFDITACTVGFRWEAVCPDNQLNPLNLVGLKIELSGSEEFPGALLTGTGTVVSAEPFIDEMMGPGVWVVIDQDPQP